MTDADTISYEVTIEDPKVFTRPWTISMPLHRQTDADRIFEYQCQAEAEEANGAFERDPKTWYPGAVGGTVQPSRRLEGRANRPWKAPGTRRARIKRLRGRQARPAGLLHARRRRRQLRTRQARAATSSHPAAAASSSIRRTACFRCSRGRRPRPRAASSRSAGTTTRPPTASSPASHGRCTCPRRCRSSRPPGYLVILHERMSWRSDPAGRPRAPAGPHASVAGGFDWQVGRRYARRRHHQPQREDVAERGGRDRQPRPARRRAVDTDRRRTHPVRGDRIRSARLHAAVDDRLRDQPAEGRAPGSGVSRRQPGSATPEGHPGRGACKGARAQSCGARSTFDEGIPVAWRFLSQYLGGSVVPIAAHHSFSAEYDSTSRSSSKAKSPR